MDKRLVVEAQQAFEVNAQPIEESSVVDDAVLDDLGEPRLEFARRQRFQGADVSDHAARLIERADEVFCRGGG